MSDAKTTSTDLIVPESDDRAEFRASLSGEKNELLYMVQRLRDICIDRETAIQLRDWLNQAFPTDTPTAWEKDGRTWNLVRLLIECRDALPAITLASAKLHNLDLTLDKKIEAAIEPWKCAEGEQGI